MAHKLTCLLALRFEDFKKPTLENTLDRHLSTNQSKFYGLPKLDQYYRRIMNPPRGSPIKREPKPELSPKVALANTPSRNAPTKTEEESSSEESYDPLASRCSLDALSILI